MVIKVLDHTSSCYSNEDGEVIYRLLKEYLKDSNTVTVSFMGINSITSSFTNTAFIELLNDYDIRHIQKHLNFKDTNRQINSMIKNRFTYESNRRKNLSLV